ncbi:MAG: indolepyruvate oxidoreductase subunit beta family protein [Burkholderiaceae bacterium]
MSTHDSSPCCILVAALGGEGGGVLADWIVECALRSGLPVQATSVPGVAQRTGATSYYIELLRAPMPAASPAPVLALSPVPGHVDVLVASELLEAARMAERGFVSERTTLVTSTHRVYTTLEKMHMADGRQDAGRMIEAVSALAARACTMDMDALARQHGTVVSAVMFGAMAGAGTLPWPRALCEAVIRDSGRGVEASLAGFGAAFDAAAGQGSAPVPRADVAGQARPDWPDGLDAGWVGRAAAWPPAVQVLAAHGARRCLDYQGLAHAQAFMAHVDSLSASATPTAHAALEEAVRQLALWMCYEDVVRVADLKSRASRFARVRSEAEARPGDIVRITEHFKPGPEEVASVLPRRLGQALMRAAERRGWLGRAHVGLHIRTTSIWGFLMLRALAVLKPWRPRSLRFHEEQLAWTAWLDAMGQLMPRAPRLAVEVAGLPQVLKGYGDTQRRGRENYTRLWRDHVAPALASSERADDVQAKALSQALKATLADPEGTLNAGHAARGEQAMFWAPRPTDSAPTVSP